MKIFGGLKPTGELHIGNYLGAIKQWSKLQKDNECVFCVCDLHAITTPLKSEDLRKNTYDSVAAYLAAGINPEKSIIFIQSHVKEHAELAWLLGTVTPVSELKKMAQFKEKSKEHPDHINAGLLNYPLLMAADILLYKTDLVPAGEDQKRHVELAGDIARRFNRKFGQTFTEPKVRISKTGSDIKSLQDPRKKMSKTDNPQGCVGLFDTGEEIDKKIKKAATDAGKQIKYSPASKPGISNLLAIYSLFSGKEIGEAEKEFKNKSYSYFKKSLALLLIEKLEPFRKKKRELETREVYIEEMLAHGRNRAQLIAQSTMQEVRKKLGFA